MGEPLAPFLEASTLGGGLEGGTMGRRNQVFSSPGMFGVSGNLIKNLRIRSDAQRVRPSF